ncbi:hypothetical protein AXF42_Ash019074 [Apostasia shenzhenica]|uniref:Uncharacterized protein n=1 Tax=Apostasia shenzhenica TaxID=1088818 RepID=A0A2I0BB87_9ASPA|nr:hypothetical protein AXF42_Ash019074 [Apostasia shenzhenica]
MASSGHLLSHVMIDLLFLVAATTAMNKITLPDHYLSVISDQRFADQIEKIGFEAYKYSQGPPKNMQLPNLIYYILVDAGLWLINDRKRSYCAIFRAACLEVDPDIKLTSLIVQVVYDMKVDHGYPTSLNGVNKKNIFVSIYQV